MTGREGEYLLDVVVLLIREISIYVEMYFTNHTVLPKLPSKIFQVILLFSCSSLPSLSSFIAIHPSLPSFLLIFETSFVENFFQTPFLCVFSRPSGTPQQQFNLLLLLKVAKRRRNRDHFSPGAVY